MTENLLARISKEHLQAYEDRTLTAAEVATTYSVTKNYVWMTLPRRPAKVSKQELKQAKRILAIARKQFRDSVARKLDTGLLTIDEAAKTANCSKRNMYRHLSHIRK